MTISVVPSEELEDAIQSDGISICSGGGRKKVIALVEYEEPFTTLRRRQELEALCESDL